MDDILVGVLILGGYLALQRYVLPKLGVPT